MTDFWVSVGVLCVAVLLCQTLYQLAAGLLPRACQPYLLEAACTLQLCVCTHELKLLGETSPLNPALGFTLTYAVTVVHVSTFRDATVNPCGAVEKVFRGTSSLAAAALVVACHFGAGLGARACAQSVWALGLSEGHRRHHRFGFRCFDPMGGTLLEAAATEVACAFAFQAAILHAHKVDERLRAHFFAAVVTAIVYLGGSVSGAVFNPVLAFSVLFSCSGHTYLEYCFVYWLGPVLGVVSCILLFEKVLPFLSGKNHDGLDRSAALKQKRQ